jgi:hypothetical protein
MVLFLDSYIATPSPQFCGRTEDVYRLATNEESQIFQGLAIKAATSPKHWNQNILMRCDAGCVQPLSLKNLAKMAKVCFNDGN